MLQILNYFKMCIRIKCDDLFTGTFISSYFFVKNKLSSNEYYHYSAKYEGIFLDELLDNASVCFLIYNK